MVESILTRIQELALAPGYLAARHALATLEQHSSRGQQWWVPEDIPTAPSNDRVSSHPADFVREDVARVLTDL